MAQYVQQLTVFLFQTWYTVNKKKWGLNMLKSWTPGEEPDKDEMKVQLEKTRNRLYDLQMKIKSTSSRYWSFLRGGVQQAKAV